jgi:phosphonate degradation associated HDIG domain protein
MDMDTGAGNCRDDVRSIERDCAYADELLALLVARGHGQYGYEPVTQLEHALQSAMLAERAGDSAALIIAALFHDIGHLVDDADVTQLVRGEDDRHEMRAVEVLRRCFGSEVCGPVALHVAAKRFLCATEPGYVDMLSSASQQSLSVQGGIMSAGEVTRFQGRRYFAAAVRLRRYDDAAKLAGCTTPSPEHFARYWRSRGTSTS